MPFVSWFENVNFLFQEHSNQSCREFTLWCFFGVLLQGPKMRWGTNISAALFERKWNLCYTTGVTPECFVVTWENSRELKSCNSKVMWIQKFHFEIHFNTKFNQILKIMWIQKFYFEIHSNTKKVQKLNLSEFLRH